MRIGWVESRQGLWTLLTLLIAALSLIATMYQDSISMSANGGDAAPKPSTKETKSIIQSNRPEAADTPATDPVDSISYKKRVVEGEIFQACGMSDLFMTTSHSAQTVAVLGRKHGAFFGKQNEMIREYVMSLNLPLQLSADCLLIVTGQYEVQGHSGFEISITRKSE